MEGRRSSPAYRPQYGARRKASAKMPAHPTTSGQPQRQNRKGSTRKAGSNDDLNALSAVVWSTLLANACLKAGGLS